MNLSKVTSMTVLAMCVATGAKAGVEIQAGKSKVTVGAGVRTSFTSNDNGVSKTDGVTVKRTNNIEIDRSDLKIDIQANQKLKFSFALEPHAFQRDGGAGRAVEAAYFTYSPISMLNIMAGIQTLNLGGVENVYDAIDVYHYSNWYKSYGFGSQVMDYAPAIAPQVVVGPLAFTLQLADRSASDVSSTAAKGTTDVDPILITSRVDVKLPVGSGSITPTLTYAAITNQQKQLTAGVMIQMAGLTADVGYNRAMYAKNDKLAGNPSTDSDGKAIASNVSSIELMAKYDLAMGEMTLSPWLKYANLTNDMKVAGTEPKALETYNSEIFLGAALTIDAMTAGLSYAIQSGDYFKASGSEETRSNGTLGLHFGAKI